MYDQPTEDVWIDLNGAPTERIFRDGQEIIVHYDDLPEKDCTVLDGIPCTTALRTMIDLAPQSSSDELASMVRQCLDRQLFSADEAFARVHEPDMLLRPGALVFKKCLERLVGR